MYFSKEETVSTSLRFWEICIIPGKNFENTGWNVEEMLIPKQKKKNSLIIIFFLNGNIFWVSPGAFWTRDLREKKEVCTYSWCCIWSHWRTPGRVSPRVPPQRFWASRSRSGPWWHCSTDLGLKKRDRKGKRSTWENTKATHFASQNKPNLSAPKAFPELCTR